MPACPKCSAEVPITQRYCGSCGTSMHASSEAGTVVMTAASFTPYSRASTPEPERFAPGAILAQRYRVAGRIGRGGMGEVYRAYDLTLEQDVALKFLSPGLTTSPAALDRFRNEVRLARQVSHPNVCRVYDIGEIEDAPFLSMEYVDGEDLASLLRRIGRLPADKALDLARRLCAGLAAAHEKGVLHRDLKPANIMINGRGEVLITDFGLAAVAGSVGQASAHQGTPAYQAPEQLAGHEVTFKSDLYALGLVLYEMFTGKRAFEGSSVEELAHIQRESTPMLVSSIVKDVDPAVDRAILRCLAADPKQRPVSAKAIALSLPGGDPLAAALAAGETPSPATVAQAGEGEGLRPAVAVALLAATLLGSVVVTAVGAYTLFPRLTPFGNSPEALTFVARDFLERLGYGDRPVDTASGMEADSEYLDQAPRRYSLDRIRAQMAAARPWPLSFWYRESPRPMNPFDLNYGTVTPNNPAFSVPGMIRLRLDMLGRLVAFEARPAEKPAVTPAAPDWKLLFDAAKLDPAQFQPAAPEWTPAMACDARAAWTGAWPEAPEVPIRIEAAAYVGRPVSFRIIHPWTVPQGPEPSDAADVFWSVLLYCVVFPIGILLARRNVRLKRGDRTGAVRVAAAGFVITLAGALLLMHYFWSGDLVNHLFHIGAPAFTMAVLFGVAYLALEPYVRRRRPSILISWSRLLQNGPRDPLVARDVLIGMAGSVLMRMLVLGQVAVNVSASRRLDLLFPQWFSVDGARQYLGQLLVSCSGEFYGVIFLVILFFLVRLLLRRDWLAAPAVVLLLSLSNIVAGAGRPAALGLSWSIGFLTIFLLLRYGVLTCAVYGLMGVWTGITPMTLDPSRWFFGYSLTLYLLTAALALWAFRTALGGRKVLRDETLA